MHPYKAKYQFSINKYEGAGLKHCKYSKAFIEYSNNMIDSYKNIEEYNAYKNWKILIVFHDMVAEMLSNKKLYEVVTEIVSIVQTYFAAPEN